MRSLAQARNPDRQGFRAPRGKIRVMVVDDSLTARTALARIVDGAADITVAATASSAETAIRQLAETPVDVILLDLEMPGMGGLEALPKLIETASRAQILVVSSLTEEGAEHTLAALSMGAADTMLKPRSGQFTPQYCDQLVERVRALGRHHGGDYADEARGMAAPVARQPGKRPSAVAIGASTGGIHAISLLLRDLPTRFNLPILITQHLPETFVPVLARQIEMVAVRETVVATNGTRIASNAIYIAPGNAHLGVVERSGELFVSLSDEASESGCMPSVDPMLRSLARACGGEALGVILSGMGRDGSLGAKALVEAGGTIFAQDESSSAVWGMPRAVCAEGLAAQIASPQDLSEAMLKLAGASAWT